MKVLKRVVPILLVFCMAFSIQAFSADEKINVESILVEQAKDFIADNYKFGVEENELYRKALKAIIVEHPELAETAIEAMLEDLDNYSYYVKSEDYINLLNSLNGVFVGIGVNIMDSDGYVTVISPIDGSPAQRAGILADDKIVSVNGQDVVGKGIEYVQGLVLGEAGTSVNIGILRNGELIEYTIVRDKVEQASASYWIRKEDGVGYIKIAQFTANTPTLVKNALRSFESSGVKKLIIDVRDNPGGEKGSLIQTLQLFMPAGEIFHVNYKDPSKNEVYYAYNKSKLNYKIAILANENSASAAEAFTGSMKDKKVATIVGMTTFGKGTVQIITPTILQSAVKLTVATYTTANGTEINKKGVEPDIMVQNKTVPFEENPDAIPMQFSVEINENSEPEAIKAVQQRLATLGFYYGEYDGEYKENLKNSVKSFQTHIGAEQTGIMDIMTQIELNNETRCLDTIVDLQLEAALEALK